MVFLYNSHKILNIFQEMSYNLYVFTSFIFHHINLQANEEYFCSQFIDMKRQKKIQTKLNKSNKNCFQLD